MHKRFYPVVLQEALDPSELVRNRLENASLLEDFLQDVEGLLRCTVEFLELRNQEQIAIGFHPTTRNYGVRNNQWFYLDTFPPMLLKQQQLNRLMIDYLPLAGAAKLLIPPSWMNRVSDEYYDDCKMLTGIVGSACRLRPNETRQILIRCQSVLSDLISDEALKVQLMQAIERPPRLSAVWVLLRRLLAKKGAPNI